MKRQAADWSENVLKEILKDGGPNLSQSDFAELVGVDRASICRFVKRGILPEAGKWREWWTPYHAYFKGVIAGRTGAGY